MRTLDALHLASIEFLRLRQQQVELASYDERLVAGARALTIQLYGNGRSPRAALFLAGKVFQRYDAHGGLMGVHASCDAIAIVDTRSKPVPEPDIEST